MLNNSTVFLLVAREAIVGIASDEESSAGHYPYSV